MCDRFDGVRAWARRAWPDQDWGRAEARHGAFHEVLVLPGGPVARVAEGLDQERRVARETLVMSLMANLDLPVPVPTPVSVPVTLAGRTGMLTSFVPGQPLHDAAWPDVRDQLMVLLGALQQTRLRDLHRSLPKPREWCGGASWPDIVHDRLISLLPTSAQEEAARVVADLLVAEQGAEPGLAHGDFGLHNVLWSGSNVSGLIDFDHCCWGDPAMDIAPLVGAFHAGAVTGVVDADTVRRAMYHRATLSLQVAAAAELAGKRALRDHALGNFAQRLAEGTLYDPGGELPAT